MDNIHANWEDTPEVAMALELSDPGQPYSCSAWGNQFDDSEPLIINGGSPYYDWWEMFETTYVPAHAFIDHNMIVHYKTNTMSYGTANMKIEEMLEDCGECWIEGDFIPDESFSNQSYQEYCCEIFGGVYHDSGDWDEFYCEDSAATWIRFCGNPDGDNDGFNTDDDNCPNDYNPSQDDTDSDGIGDVCDECNNLSGDLNDDMIIDILDIVTVVNMVLTGGVNSPDFTDCEKEDADITLDGTINILDVIQIINLVLGNGLSLNDSMGSIDYVDVTYTNEGNDLFLTFDSKYAVGLEIALPGVISFAMIDASNQSDFTLATKNTNKCLIYSSMNNTFNNSSLTLQIPGGSEFNIKDINVIVGNDVGQEMPVRWLASEIHNFKIAKMYPNPFNPVTQIDYTVDQAGELRLSVYNILGQEVAVLHNGYQTEGEFKVTWDASSLSSGVYYMSMVMNGQIETKKAVLVK